MGNKTSQKVLLELLKDRDRWVSGNEIADSLGVTRETIWKNINLLKKRGHQIQSQKNLGYKYESSSKLDEVVINFYKNKSVDHVAVEEQVDSTQMYAKNYLATHQVEKTFAVISEQQTQGYGRRGRSFYSPKEQGLYFSIVIPKPTFEINQVGLITTGVAYVIAQTFKDFFPEREFKLKWVNDILMNRRKVAGIITEAITEVESASTQAFVIGVGINLTTPEFPEELQQKAGAIVAKNEPNIDRNLIAAQLINTIVDNWQNYLDGSFLSEYRKMSIVIGKPVTLQVGTKQVKGIATDINEYGNIVVKLDEGQVKAFNNGEITKVNLDW